MIVTAHSKSCGYGQPGIFRGELQFENPVLAEYRWPLYEIRSAKPGPRLCVSAGVHVNEVSAIEAAVRLQTMFDLDAMAGSVSIIPLINQPALYRHSEYVCPIDGKNINSTFPGQAGGTFSEALCDAIMREWCKECDCYIDMHGGDLRERVSKFSIYQQTENPDVHAQARRLALCFDAEIVLGLPTSYLDKPGRPPTGFARQDRIALMSEAGSNGLLEEDAIAFHIDGVLNIAHTLGIVSRKPKEFNNARILCNDYLWTHSPATGEFHAESEPGNRVVKGERLGTIRNFFGEILADVKAEADGLLLWRITHPSIKEGDPLLALAVEERTQNGMAGHGAK
ncbi:putative deacylase [Rhizobium mesoamericanum]|uniref:succinylglutamate desuccinylase/aspartoacylase domain-containing protein n=1 Tax=Rhizobium mesoamericanum TaxID=1079800 RepID=UPI002782E77C|nr:succinylglutamate desuccinylase/aspartoacylase family protein [Rhizobium mesoamericanum]MDQ0562958.1 putative deacylase [Rhizobium mesoamericanum]